MKKVILFLLLLSILSPYVFANNYELYCSNNHPLKTFNGNIASLSGFNLLTRNIAENIIQKEIKKETDSKFKIKINNFYGTNILNGEIKSIKATSKKYEHDGIYLNDINIETICSYNHILFENETLYFKENMVLSFSANSTNSNLKKTIKSGKLNKNLAKILSKALKYDGFYSIINSFLPIEFPIKIDKDNQAKLKIENIKKSNETVSFNGFILIKKNK